MPPRRDVDELTQEVRRAAEKALAPENVRFDRGSARPLGRKGRATRESIIRAASEVFTELGWSSSSMGSIAERAGVSVGTLYQYFRSKEEIVATTVADWAIDSLGEVKAWNPEEGIDGLGGLVHRFVTMYAATAPMQRFWGEVSLVDPALGRLRDDLTELFVHLFAESFIEASKAGLLDAGADPLETSRAINAMIDQYCQQVFVRRSGAVSPDQAARLLTDMTLRALGAGR